jgi:hypothetical protein
VKAVQDFIKRANQKNKFSDWRKRKINGLNQTASSGRESLSQSQRLNE